MKQICSAFFCSPPFPSHFPRMSFVSRFLLHKCCEYSSNRHLYQPRTIVPQRKPNSIPSYALAAPTPRQLSAETWDILSRPDYNYGRHDACRSVSRRRPQTKISFRNPTPGTPESMPKCGGHNIALRANRSPAGTVDPLCAARKPSDVDNVCEYHVDNCRRTSVACAKNGRGHRFAKCLNKITGI